MPAFGIIGLEIDHPLFQSAVVTISGLGNAYREFKAVGMRLAGG